MKNILIICNTYYQLEVAIQLKNTLFAEEKVEVLISDHSKGTEEVVEKLKERKVFEDCQWICSKKRNQELTFFQKFQDCFEISCRKKNRFSFFLENLSEKRIDEIVFFNCTIEIDGIFSILKRMNKNLKISMFEEGILSYSINNYPMGRRWLVAMLSHALDKPTLYTQPYVFYCFYPEIYEGKGLPQRIPLISRESVTAKLLNTVFMPDLRIYDGYKYIFFTSVYDFEGGKPVGEYELVCKVAKLVGKGNLLIKTHPRDIRTIYTDNGFNVDQNSSIPWEVIQLSGDFRNKVFMTINSGSVLSGSVMSENPVRTYYMYKLCDISGNKSCKKNIYDIEKLLLNNTMKEILRTVRIAERIEDIL